MDAPNLHRRLAKIIGQVQAIDRMIDEDVPCEDVLSQINAAKSALNKAGQVVLEGHIKHCVRDGIEHGNADETIEKFTKAVERCSKSTVMKTKVPQPLLLRALKNFHFFLSGSFSFRLFSILCLEKSQKKPWFTP